MKQIAIDGPSGSGKSTIAKIVAQRLGFLYLDTGAMYRAVTLLGLRRRVRPENERELVETARSARIEFRGSRVYLGEEDVTEEIRSDEVTKHVYLFAQNAQVREILVELQRRIAGENPVVMDGRDIGTVVLPDAPIKVFLTASAEARASRRFREIAESPARFGYEKPPTYEYILEEVNRRDKVDSERAASPLRASEDAVHIDSTSMTIDEVVERVLKLVEEEGCCE